MSSNDTLPTFVAALADSQLFDDAQLAVLDDLETAHTDPRELAGALLQRGCLTPWQAAQRSQGGPLSLVLGQYVLLEPRRRRHGAGLQGPPSAPRPRRRPEGHPQGDSTTRRRCGVSSARSSRPPSSVASQHRDGLRRRPGGATHFFAMEFVDGIDLGSMVKDGGPLPVAQACDYMGQAAMGLQHAFERGLTHRDIKPPTSCRAHRRQQRLGNHFHVAQAQYPHGHQDPRHGPGPRRQGRGERRRQPADPGRDGDGHAGLHRRRSNRRHSAPPTSAPTSTASAVPSIFYSPASVFPGGTITEKLLRHNMEEPRRVADAAGVRPEYRRSSAA